MSSSKPFKVDPLSYLKGIEPRGTIEGPHIIVVDREKCIDSILEALIKNDWTEDMLTYYEKGYGYFLSTNNFNYCLKEARQRYDAVEYLV